MLTTYGYKHALTLGALEKAGVRVLSVWQLVRGGHL